MTLSEVIMRLEHIDRFPYENTLSAREDKALELELLAEQLYRLANRERRGQ